MKRHFITALSLLLADRTALLEDGRAIRSELLDISFSEALWNTVIDHVTVYADERLVFHFKNGAEVPVQI